MTDAQIWRISQLEKKVEEQDRKIEALTTLRDQLLGMGSAAKFGIWMLGALGGFGLVDGVIRIVQWVQQPINSLKTH